MKGTTMHCIYLLFVLAVAFAIEGCAPTVDLTVRYLPSQALPSEGQPTVTTPDKAHVHRIGANAVTDRWSNLAGTSGTVTIAAGFCVLAVSAHATSAASATIAPSGPYVTAPVTGPAITIPAGVGFTPLALPPPESAQLCDGTVFVFTGTDAYYIALTRVNP